jgi:hypothetical protein
LREKAYGTKIAKRFLEFILFTLFFVQKKSAAKEVKKRAVLSLCHFKRKLKRARLSPP